MVCTANICRSPMAEGIMRHRLQELGLQRAIRVASAGTRASLPGHKPDARAQKALAEAGVSLSRIKARQITVKDMLRSDYIVAMDTAIYDNLIEMCPPEHRHKVSLLMSYAPELGMEEVPDPYYGSYSGFEKVFQLIDPAVTQLLGHVVRAHAEHI